MRCKDEFDYEAEQLYDMVRDGLDDEVVIRAIATALRDAAGEPQPVPPERLERLRRAAKAMP